jgi:hypothetical protein
MKEFVINLSRPEFNTQFEESELQAKQAKQALQEGPNG